MIVVPPVTEVPLLDLKRSTAPLQAELRAAFERVLQSGRYVMGPEVTALEDECAQYLGVEHAIGVSSGTDALLLALMTLGVGSGDEVICPTYTFFATAGTIWRTGAKPVFVECRPCCCNVDPDDVIRKISDRTRAIIPVHLFGQCADMNPIVRVAKERGIPIIEDAAQALGSEYKGKRAGGLGDIGCFSFFPSKNLGAFGDAGLVTTNNGELAEKARILRTHGGKPKYYYSQVGGNFRIDPLQAALIRVKLAHLDEYTAGRQKNAAMYTEVLSQSGLAATGSSLCGDTALGATDSSKIVLPPQCQDRHIYNQYVIRFSSLEQREVVRRSLGEHKIGSEVYYPVPMHTQKCFASLGHGEGAFPVSEAAAAQTLAVPIFPELTEEEIRFVAEHVVQAVSRAG